MKKLLYIALLKVKLMLKDKTAFIWILLAPIVFVVIISFAYSGGSSDGEVKYPVSLINLDNGSYSKELIDMIKKDQGFKISEEDYETAKENVENGNTSMGIVIPEGFSSALKNGEIKSIGILKLQDNESTMAMSTVIYNYLYQLKVSVNTGDSAATVLSNMGKIKDGEKDSIENKLESDVLKNLSSPAITYKSENVSTDKKDGLDGLSYTAIGIFVLFIMFFVMSSAGSILEEKETGTWNRVVATPTGDYSIMGGYMLGSLVQGWIQVGLLVIVSRFIFKVNWGNSFLGLFLLFTCFLIAVIGLGVALSSLVKSKAQLSILSPIITMPTCLIAGCMWPREVMPDFMQTIANFVPQTWVMKGMTDLVSRGSDISAVLLPCAVLMVFAVIFFIVGLTFLSFKNR